eukprot:1036305_1
MGALLYRWNGCVVLCLCFYNGFDCSFSLQYHVMAVNVVSSLMDVCFVASPSATACSFSFFSSYLVLMMGCGSVGMVQREWNDSGFVSRDERCVDCSLFISCWCDNLSFLGLVW